MSETNGKEREAWLPPLLLVLLVGALPSFFLYAQNAYEVPFSDVALAMGASVLLGVAAFLLLRLITHKIELSALLAALLTALFLNFNFVVSLVDLVLAGARVRVYYAAALLIAAVLLIAVWRFSKAGACKAINRILLMACAGVFVVNLITAVPGAARRLRATAYASADQARSAGETLPNLYYLLPDEYASFTQIKKYYDYDNAAFHDFLTERGFCVSDDSFNHDANTMKNMADNMNLAQIVTADMSYADYVELFNNGALYGVLSGLGYDLKQLGSLYPLPKLLEQDMFSFQKGAATMNGESALEILFQNSMLMPIQNILYWNLIEKGGELVAFDYLDDPANYTAPHGRAIFLYVCCPHPPFYYDADGNELDEAYWTNWTDRQFYLDQYRYITKRLEKTIDTILKNDPNAIILLQSDHGLRQHYDSDQPMDFEIEFQDQRQILNALYFGGKTVDISGLSGYNTWRALLNELGLSYEILPEEP